VAHGGTLDKKAGPSLGIACAHGAITRDLTPNALDDGIKRLVLEVGL
jgi:hypothetical protein